MSFFDSLSFFPKILPHFLGFPWEKPGAAAMPRPVPGDLPGPGGLPVSGSASLFTVGDDVSHREYGRGQVLKATHGVENTYDVQFPTQIVHDIPESQLTKFVVTAPGTRPEPLFKAGDQTNYGIITPTYAPGRGENGLPLFPYNPIWAGPAYGYQYWVVGRLYPTGNGILEQYLQKV